MVNSAPVSTDVPPNRDAGYAHPRWVHPVATWSRPDSGCNLVIDEGFLSSEVSCIDFTCEGSHPRVFTLAPVVARLGSQASSRAVKTVRLLQTAVPTSAVFTVPFCIRPDPDEDDYM